MDEDVLRTFDDSTTIERSFEVAPALLYDQPTALRSNDRLGTEHWIKSASTSARRNGEQVFCGCTSGQAREFDKFLPGVHGSVLFQTASAIWAVDGMVWVIVRLGWFQT